MDITELKPKWSVSLALGLALWIAVMFAESIMFSALGMFVGGTAAMVIFSMVVQIASLAGDGSVHISFVQSCIRSFMLSCMNAFMHSCIRSFIHPPLPPPCGHKMSRPSLDTF